MALPSHATPQLPGSFNPIPPTQNSSSRAENASFPGQGEFVEENVNFPGVGEGQPIDSGIASDRQHPPPALRGTAFPTGGPCPRFATARPSPHPATSRPHLRQPILPSIRPRKKEFFPGGGKMRGCNREAGSIHERRGGKPSNQRSGVGGMAVVSLHEIW